MNIYIYIRTKEVDYVKFEITPCPIETLLRNSHPTIKDNLTPSGIQHYKIDLKMDYIESLCEFSCMV